MHSSFSGTLARTARFHDDRRQLAANWTRKTPSAGVGGQGDVQGCGRVAQGAQPVAQHGGGVQRKGQCRRDPSGVAPGGAGGHAGAVHHGDIDSALLQEPRRRQPDDARTDHDRRSRSAVNALVADHHIPPLLNFGCDLHVGVDGPGSVCWNWTTRRWLVVVIRQCGLIIAGGACRRHNSVSRNKAKSRVYDFALTEATYWGSAVMRACRLIPARRGICIVVATIIDCAQKPRIVSIRSRRREAAHWSVTRGAARADHCAAAVPAGSLARPGDVLLVFIPGPSDAALGR